MYLCICNAIREDDFRSMAAKCCGNAEAIYGQMGYQPQCRRCLEDADDILDETRGCLAA